MRLYMKEHSPILLKGLVRTTGAREYDLRWRRVVLILEKATVRRKVNRTRRNKHDVGSSMQR
ncbi:MAG: hypothetical protein ABIN54_10690 [candidate division WOR-3 bacterium]